MTVLCIDDDEEDVELFCEAVNKMYPAIECLTASSGEQALSLLSSIDGTHQLPAFIFLDINMPRMDGKETLKEIRKIDRYNAAQIIMFSTSLVPHDTAEYLTLGADHFITKANSLNGLCDTLREFLKQKLI